MQGPNGQVRDPGDLANRVSHLSLFDAHSRASRGVRVKAIVVETLIYITPGARVIPRQHWRCLARCWVECDGIAVESDEITVGLAERLVASQFPRWAELDVTPVVESGVDNRTFRLGEDMSVRLPAAERYAHQVDKEHRWLPMLAGRVPLPIPQPLARGEPDQGYPWPWSIYRWLPGAPVSSAEITDLGRFAADLGAFLAALHRIDPAGGPPATDRNWFRASASTRVQQTRAAINALDGVIDTIRASEVWEAARCAPQVDSPTWIHGDVSSSNLLVIDGRLSAVIDFGCAGIGDPAFDLEFAWGLLSEESRATFREQLGLDETTWARGRGWKLWAASRALVEGLETGADWVDWPRKVIAEVLSDHQASSRRRPRG